MRKIPLTPRHFVALALFLVIALYALYQTRNVILGPELEISSPQPATTTNSPLIVVAGQARNITRIAINNAPIFTDEAGHFREKLLLAPGYTILKLTVEDRFGRQVERRLDVVYLPV